MPEPMNDNWRYPKVPRWYRFKTCTRPRRILRFFDDFWFGRQLGWRNSFSIAWGVLWLVHEDYGLYGGDKAGWEK